MGRTGVTVDAAMFACYTAKIEELEADMDAIPYIRFSDPKQEKGHSKERQTQDILAFCLRQGWPIREVIEDLGQSAWKGAHLTQGNLGKFANRVRAGEVAMPAVLVVEKLDRLSRQGHHVMVPWMRELCGLGLRIAVVDGGRVYDATSLTGDLMPEIEAMLRGNLAFKESQQKSERVLDALTKKMAKAKEKGTVITAKAPGWLKVLPDRSGFEVDDYRADIVREVYEMAADGKGARWIAKTLNERGEVAWGLPRADGKPRTWEMASIRLMLAQPAVEGDYQPGFSNTSKSKRTKFTEKLVGYYPRIVDADLVARARAAVQARKTGPRLGGRHTGNVANLFAGLVRCGECDNRMHLRLTSGERRYLRCNHAARSGDCSQKASFAYGPLESAVLDEILHLALDDQHFAKVDETGALARSLASIEKVLADQGEKARRLAKVLALVEDDPAVVEELLGVRKEITALETQRDEVAEQLAAARGAVTPEEHLARVRDLRDALQDENEPTRQAARLRVQRAMQGLGVRLVCEVKAGERETLLMLSTGFFCRIRHDGSVIGRVDMAVLASRGVAPHEGQAAQTARLLTDVIDAMTELSGGEPREGAFENDADQDLVAAVGTHLRRKTAHDAL